jgi:RHS repeat-associated protein
LTEQDRTVTTFTKTGDLWLTTEVVSAEANSTVTYAYDGNNVSWIFAPKPGGVTSCSTSAQTAGCRALELIYSNENGKSRVAEVRLHIWNPRSTNGGTPGADAGMDTISVAKYSYSDDAERKLLAVWDPRLGDDGDSGRPALKTRYTYGAVGGKTVVETVKRPGVEAWTVNYDNKGRVTTVTRPQADDRGGDPATWTVKYDLPLSSDADGLPDLSAAATGTWGQAELDAPFSGAAVFGADQTPSSSPTASQYQYANLSYWTKAGRTSNTASYGAGAWQIDSTTYDDKGNPVWQLSPAGKLKVLQERATATAENRLEATRVAASKYATLTVYTPGVERRIQDVYTPMSQIKVQDTRAPEGGVLGRKLTRTTYDDTSDETLKPGYPTSGVPSGGFGLPVEETERVTTGTFPYERNSTNQPSEYDVNVTRYLYDPVTAGDGDGWRLRAPTRVKGKVGSDAWTTNLTRFDTEGKIIESRSPQGTETLDGPGSDSRSTKTTYYTVGQNSADALCGDSAAWAGMVCKTAPGGGDAPTTRVKGYSLLLQPTRVEETGGGLTRAVVASYDPAGRALQSRTTTSGGAQPDREIPAVSTEYSNTTGLPTSLAGGGKTQSTTYDTWGRPRIVKDETGAVAAETEYDTAGRVKSSNDGKATYKYTYNGTDSRGRLERRGLATSIDVGSPEPVSASSPSTFTGAYDEMGSLAEQTYPGGVKATWARDLNGAEIGLSYVTADNVQLLGYANTVDVDGRVITQTGAGSEQAFTYDKRDRLIQVKDTRAGQCTTRKYEFSGDSNRTSLTTHGPGSGGVCQTGTGTSQVSTYNGADQLSGDVYDGLGRTTTLTSGAGGTATIGYHSNDMVATITQGPKSQEYGLDLTARVSSVKNLTNGVSLSETINHYDNGSDSPAWSETKTRPSASTTWSTGWTRNVADLKGDLGLTQDSSGTTTLHLSNLHGDVAATYVLGPTPTFATAAAVDEYGKPVASTGGTRYGWLGAKQRDSMASAGLILMGARLYNPQSGRFLTRDSIQGGNDNAYTYPGDPVNHFDLSGEFNPVKWIAKKIKKLYNKVKGKAKKAGKSLVKGVKIVKSEVKKASGKIVTGLEIVSYIPYVGTFASGALVITYLLQKEYKKALSAAAGLGGGKLASKAFEKALKNGSALDRLEKIVSEYTGYIHGLATAKVVEAIQGG